MAIIAPSAPDTSFEEFYAGHVGEFRAYLSGVLGANAEGRGGRIGVADALQAGMLRILGEWPQLREADGGQRDRQVYRCLRDAAGEALRREHGRRDQGGVRPWVSAYDFTALDGEVEDLPAREREMTASVLGAMAADVAAGNQEERAMLDRGVLLAGLRALSEQEAVVLIAVDHVGWEQTALAERLGVDPSKVYATLFAARKLFYTVARHAAGIEVDDEERARLYAYQDGVLKGRDKRLARRHINHCQACQALVRERRVFGQSAHRVLSGLPFVLGGEVLAKKSAVKAAVIAPASSAAAAGKGLLAQAGAAQALGGVFAILALGFGAGAWLSIAKQEHPRAASPAVAGLSSLSVRSPGASLSTPPRVRAKHATSTETKARHKKRVAVRHVKKPARTTGTGSSSTSGGGQSTISSPPAQSSSPPAQTPSPDPPSDTGGGQSSGGGTGSSAGGGEFFGG